jgi:hypothetical protein
VRDNIKMHILCKHWGIRCPGDGNAPYFDIDSRFGIILRKWLGIDQVDWDILYPPQWRERYQDIPLGFLDKKALNAEIRKNRAAEGKLRPTDELHPFVETVAATALKGGVHVYPDRLTPAELKEIGTPLKLLPAIPEDASSETEGPYVVLPVRVEIFGYKIRIANTTKVGLHGYLKVSDKEIQIVLTQRPLYAKSQEGSPPEEEEP